MFLLVSPLLLGFIEVLLDELINSLVIIVLLFLSNLGLRGETQLSDLPLYLIHIDLFKASFLFGVQLAFVFTNYFVKFC